MNHHGLYPKSAIDQMMRQWSTIMGTTYFEPACDPGPDMPDLPRRETDTPLLGYREWALVQVKGEWRLKSKHTSTVWEGPILRADAAPDDRSPWNRGGPEAGSHGIYAWTLCAGPMAEHTGLGGALMLPSGWLRGERSRQRVEGVVELLGKVVVHERGYRAEMCRIRKLWLIGDDPSPEAAASLAETYACDVDLASDEWADDYEHVPTQPETDARPGECPVCGETHPTRPLRCAHESSDRRLIVPETQKVRAPRPPEGWEYSEADPMPDARPDKPARSRIPPGFDVEMDAYGNISLTHTLD